MISNIKAARGDYAGDYLVGAKILPRDFKVIVTYENGEVAEYYNDVNFSTVSSVTTKADFTKAGNTTVKLVFTEFGTEHTANISVNVVNSYKATYQFSNNPAFTEDNKYCFFGYYPKDAVSVGMGHSIRIDEKTYIDRGMHRYYVGSDGNYYVKVTGHEVCYRVEAIKWKVLKQDSNGYLLFSNYILDNEKYFDTDYVRRWIYPNSYADSRIRAFLNGIGYPGTETDPYGDGESFLPVLEFENRGFLQTAFTEEAQTKIKETVVDNSINSIFATGINVDNSKNAYICDNTTDKIFLLSLSEITSKYDDFSVHATDISRLVSTNYGGSNSYALRTPPAEAEASPKTRVCSIVVDRGSILETPQDVVNKTVGIAPAMWITK